MTVFEEVEAILIKNYNAIVLLEKAAIAEAEPLIKRAVRDYLSRHTKVTGFVFGMGEFFWLIGANPKEHLPGTSSIDRACDAFYDAYGTMTWRIDRKDGVLVEMTDW